MMQPETHLTERLVFISHSGQDTWVAKQIAREIERCGARPFLDEAEIDAGADFEEDIRNALERAHEMVVLLTPWALERPYVLIELGAAWGRRIPIVALLLGITPGELQSRPGAPVLIKKRDHLELNNIETYLEQLRRRVQYRIESRMSKPQVFISYSRTDADWARSFAEALRERGVDVWLDQFQIAVGESLIDALEEGLRESDVLVTLIDPGSSLTPNLLFEFGAAIGMGKRIIPIVPPEVDTSKLPFNLRTRRYLLRGSPENTADELAHSLEAA